MKRLVFVTIYFLICFSCICQKLTVHSYSFKYDSAYKYSALRIKDSLAYFRNIDIIYNLEFPKDTVIKFYLTTEEYNDFKLNNKINIRKIIDDYEAYLILKNEKIKFDFQKVVYHYYGKYHKLKLKLKKGDALYYYQKFSHQDISEHPNIHNAEILNIDIKYLVIDLKLKDKKNTKSHFELKRN